MVIRYRGVSTLTVYFYTLYVRVEICPIFNYHWYLCSWRCVCMNPCNHLNHTFFGLIMANCSLNRLPTYDYVLCFVLWFVNNREGLLKVLHLPFYLSQLLVYYFIICQVFQFFACLVSYIVIHDLTSHVRIMCYSCIHIRKHICNNTYVTVINTVTM